MSTIENTFNDTERHIGNILTSVTELHEQITAEAQILQQQPIAETLSAIAANKLRLVEQLDNYNQQLTQILAAEDLTSTDEGISQYFQRALAVGFAIDQISQQWTEIKLLTSQCRTLNEQNGITINLLKLHTQRSLQILKGQPRTCTTYGPNGSSLPETHVRTRLSV